MDVLLLLMGLTLVAAGWLLIREYTRVLYSTYTARGRVINIEPGYWPRAFLPSEYPREQRLPAYFPVIEYYWNGGSSCFTALIPEASGTLQIGELVDVQVSRSRRRKGRIERGMRVLMGLLTSLVLLLTFGVLSEQQTFGLAHVILASLVLAVCFFIVVLYFRQQDESLAPTAPVGQEASQMSLRLQEPTAPCHWRQFRVSRHQRVRIFYSRLMGSGCVAAGAVFVLVSLGVTQPGMTETAPPQASAEPEEAMVLSSIERDDQLPSM